MISFNPNSQRLCKPILCFICCTRYIAKWWVDSTFHILFVFVFTSHYLFSNSNELLVYWMEYHRRLLLKIWKINPRDWMIGFHVILAKHLISKCKPKIKIKSSVPAVVLNSSFTISCWVVMVSIINIDITITTTPMSCKPGYRTWE